MALWTGNGGIGLRFGVFDVMAGRKIGAPNKHTVTAFFNGH